MAVTIEDLPGYDTNIEVHYSIYSDGIWKNIECRIVDSKWHWQVKADYYSSAGRELSEDGYADTPQEAAEIIEARINHWKSRA